MTLKIAELFAGVGGFRVGFENANKKLKKDHFSVVWSNQWEPGEKGQFASRVYEARFGADGHSNQDISTINPDSVKELKELDILVGGFPCQDYSVAKPRNQSKGLEGKKGVLWWDIHRFLAAKKPRMALLENVDRLLGSPIGQRGRDFAIMLASLCDLGYAVEWRVINAAEYGFAQRRRRVFIVAHKKNTEGYDRIKRSMLGALHSEGLIASGFPAIPETTSVTTFDIEGEVWELSELFNHSSNKSPFQNSGVCINRHVTTQRMMPKSRKAKTLGSIIEKDDSKVPEEYFLLPTEVTAWKRHKGAKKDTRTKKDGFVYQYAEGAMAFPDPLDKPSRTIITSEGGRSASRFKHVIQMPSGRMRRLMPTELEQLSGFPKNHTRLDGISDSRRAFFIGNALVTGIIERFGITMIKQGFLE